MEFKQLTANSFNEWVMMYDEAVKDGWVRQDDAVNCPKTYANIFTAVLKREALVSTTRKVVK